jgi:hypothetical protein
MDHAGWGNPPPLKRFTVSPGRNDRGSGPNAGQAWGIGGETGPARGHADLLPPRHAAIPSVLVGVQRITCVTTSGTTERGMEGWHTPYPYYYALARPGRPPGPRLPGIPGVPPLGTDPRCIRDVRINPPALKRFTVSSGPNRGQPGHDAGQTWGSGEERPCLHQLPRCLAAASPESWREYQRKGDGLFPCGEGLMQTVGTPTPTRVRSPGPAGPPAPGRPAPRPTPALQGPRWIYGVERRRLLVGR